MNDVVVHDANFGTRWFRLENSNLKLLLRSGLKLGTTYILGVTGHKTGAVHSTPVIIVETDGERYLVAPYGPGNWWSTARTSSTGSKWRPSQSTGPC